MGQNYDYKICRLASPEKQHERILVTGILQQDTSHNTEQVVLAYLIEINKPWFSANRLLDVLKDTLEESYPTLEANPNLDDQFEQLLKKVNRNLNDLSEVGETDWIGNLNALIVVIGDNELHFSMTGYCPSYILQNNRIRQITDNTDINTEPHPLKTFSNLASGTLQENDIVLIANSELYREVSLDSLRRLINSSTPYQSVLSIAKEAKKEKNPGISAIICQLLPTGAVNATLEPEEVLMDDIMQSPLARLKKRAAPVWGGIKHISTQAGIKTLEAAKTGQQVLGEKIIPKADELVTNLSNNLAKNKNAKEENKDIEATNESSEPAIDKAAIEPEESTATPEAVAETAPEPEEIPPEPEAVTTTEEEAKVEETTPGATKPETPIIPITELSLDSSTPLPQSDKVDSQSFIIFLKNILRVISKGIVSFNGIFPKIYGFSHKAYLSAKVWLKLRRNQKITALIGAVILVAATGLGVYNSLKPKNSSDQTGDKNATLITQIQTLQSKIDTAVSLNQTIEASKEIAEINKLFLEINNPNNSQKSTIDHIKDDIAAKEDTLSGIVRLSTVVSSATFSQPANGLIVNLPYYYGFNATSNTLLRSGKGEPTLVQEVISLPTLNDNVVAITHSTEDATPAYAITKQTKVYRMKQASSGTTLEAISPTDGEFFPGDTLATYNKNIYILDGKNGLLWKYGWNGQGYNKGLNIIDVNQYDIRKSVSIAIDGSIYILKQDGNLLKFISGKQDEAFSLRGQPEISKQLIRPAQIITNEEMSKLYIVDLGNSSGERSSAKIQVFDKNGQYIQQIGFPKEYTAIKYIDINESEKKVWVLNNDQISEFDLP